MRLDRLITLGAVKPIGRAFGRFPAFEAKPSPAERTLPVLMYHSISDDPEPAFSPYYKVCTSPARFAEHLRWLAEAGYRGVTLSKGLAWLNGREVEGEREQGAGSRERSVVIGQQSAVKGERLAVSSKRSVVGIPEKNLQEGERTEHGIFQNAHRSLLTAHSAEKLVAITFDDGFRDFHTAAFSALSQHGFTATMYLPTAFIGDSRKQFKNRDCLTWSEVMELQQAGMEFGSHTVNHPVLVKLNWPEIDMELRDSKTVLEQRLQRKSTAFAYPFAYPQEIQEYCARLGQILLKYGYESCVTTAIGRIRPGDDCFTLKRLPANSCDDLSLLSAKMAGAYDWLGIPQALARRVKRNRASARSTTPVPHTA